MLVDGKWMANWHPVQATDAKGGFVRQTSSFRNWVTPDGAAGPTGRGGFKAEGGRYHLYAALMCPWASRTLIARKLKRLDNVVSVTVAEPQITEQGWRFGDYPGADRDTLNGATYLHELYSRADPHFTGRATVPVLWDIETGGIVNNEFGRHFADVQFRFRGAGRRVYRPLPRVSAARNRSLERTHLSGS